MGLSPSVWYIVAPILAALGSGSASASGGGHSSRCWISYAENGAPMAQCESNTIVLGSAGCLGPRCPAAPKAPATHEHRYAAKRHEFTLSADNCRNNAGWIFPRHDLTGFRECIAGCEASAVAVIGDKRTYELTGKTCELKQ